MHSSPRKKLHHYNTPGHAHMLTSSCYHGTNHFSDPVACDCFLKELEKSRIQYEFQLWAYVVMPNHVHLLIWPSNPSYDIAAILNGTKGITSKRYRLFLKENDPIKHDSFLIKTGNVNSFRFWQPGGGFDRNLWNADAIHDSINYIEANPVRKKLCTEPAQWKYSSAYCRKHKVGVIPDRFNMPVRMGDPQAQRLAVI